MTTQLEEITSLQYQILKLLLTPIETRDPETYRKEAERTHQRCLHKLQAIHKLQKAMEFHHENDVAIHLDPNLRLQAIAEGEKVKDITTHLGLRVRLLQLASHQTIQDLAQCLRVERFANPYLLPQSDLRAELFANRLETAQPETGGVAVEAAIKAKNASITHSLKNSRRLMESSVLQSELNIDELASSSKDMARLSEKYSNFNAVLQNTGKLVRFINSQDKKDRKNIIMALTFFTVCCVWVIWNRLLRRPVGLLIWVLAKMLGLLRLFARAGAPPLVLKAGVMALLAVVDGSLASSSTLGDFLSATTTAALANGPPEASLSNSLEEMVEGVNNLIDQWVDSEMIGTVTDHAGRFVDEL